MNLQNIIIDFATSKVISRFTKIEYKIPSITNLAALKTEIESAYSITADRMVYQISLDQHLSEERIVLNNGATIGTKENIESNHAALNTELTTLRSEVESEITNQTA